MKPVPPLARGLPLLGSTLSISQDVTGFLVEQYLLLGPVFRVRAINREMIVLAGPEANQFFTKQGSGLFRSREFWQENDAEFGATRTMISMDGPDHKRLRAVEKQGYSRHVMENQLDDVLAIAREQSARWAPGSTMPVVDALRRLITEQLGRIVAGRSPGDYLDDVIYFIRMSLMTRVLHVYPSWFLLHPRYRRAKARTLELGRSIVAERRANPTVNASGDLVDHVLALAEEDPEFLPESDLMPAALGPYIAGLDTAASTMAFLLYVLFQHPELMRRVTEEVDVLFAEGSPTAESLGRMDVLHRVVMETLRRYPIAPGLQRTANRDFEFAGFPIAAGSTVLIATTIPHFLPELYPDPFRFDIDRYTEGRREHRQPGAYAPFGLGPHTCLGAGMAEVLIMANTAALLRYTKLEMDPPGYRLKIDPVPTPSPDRNFRWRVAAQRS